jgi:hypothetical protein
MMGRKPGPGSAEPHSSTVRKGLFVGFVDFRHLRDGEGEAVGHFADMLDLVQRKLP